MSLDRVSVHGTELLAQDLRDTYRQKLARITLDSMVQFVGLLDAQGIVLEINKVALDAVGLKLADVEGKPFWTTFWWQVSPEANEGIRDAIARAGKGESVRWDTSLYASPDGSTTIVIDASVTPVKDEQGKVVFLACEGRDITEKKAYEREIARQREELARLDELKTEFFANISHEFRTPLTLMLGPLEDALADTTDLSSANRERLTLAHRNAVRQFKLVNTLLDFSRIEAGRIDSSFEPADLPQLTAGLASVWRSAIERAGLELVVDCPPLVDPVYVDREMWEKIVLNLISNAFKFTFAGSIEVSLRATDGRAELAVRDTGTGIAAAEAPRIFDRFHRVREARSRSFEGSGIGLSLVRDLARLHGGDVGVQSEVGRGSCFRVTVPLGKDHLPADRIGAARTLGSTASRADAYVEEALHWLPEETRRGSEPVEAELEQLAPGGGNPSGGRAPARVLLVDDNSDMRAYVCRLLVQSGFEVDTASDGWSALELARERRPDLVLSDIMMPGLDGFGLLRELRADAELAEVPLIMLSARAGEEARIEGVQAGADDYLVKPFGARELLARVDAQFKMTHFRRTSGAKLYESENRFRALALASSDVIYTMSPDWKEMKHLQGRELIADTLEPSAGWMQRYIHPDDQPGVQACIDEAIRTKEVFELEHRVLRADGSFGWTFSRAIPILGDDGTITEWFGMARDVTERRRLEASLRSADRRKDEFLAPAVLPKDIVREVNTVGNVPIFPPSRILRSLSTHRQE
jgi:PAS domain S-box-containing protein